jgi:hypothetical protein
MSNPLPNVLDHQNFLGRGILRKIVIESSGNVQAQRDGLAASGGAPCWAFRCLFLFTTDKAIDRSTKHPANDGSHPEKPKLCNCPIAYKNGNTRKVLLRTAKVMQRRPHRSSLWWRGLRGGRMLHLKCFLFFIKTEFPYQG